METPVVNLSPVTPETPIRIHATDPSPFDPSRVLSGVTAKARREGSFVFAVGIAAEISAVQVFFLTTSRGSRDRS